MGAASLGSWLELVGAAGMFSVSSAVSLLQQPLGVCLV